MSTIPPSRPAMLTGCLAGLLLCAAPLTAAEPAQPENRIKALLQERLKVATEIRECLIARSQAPGVDAYEVLHEAEIGLFKARLDLCESKQDRMRVLEEMVKEAEGYEANRRMRHEGGRISNLDVLKARAYLLECRIALERAKEEK